MWGFDAAWFLALGLPGLVASLGLKGEARKIVIRLSLAATAIGAIGLAADVIKTVTRWMVPPATPSAHIEVFSGDMHPPNQPFNGIPWRSDLMDVWITFKNSSGYNYQDMAIGVLKMAAELRTPIKLGFYEIVQVEGPKCTTHLGNKLRFTSGPFGILPQGRPTDGLSLGDTTDSVFINCDRISDGDSVRFLLAVTNYPIGQKVKPAAFGIRYDYTVDGQKYTREDQCVDSLDMDKGSIGPPAQAPTVEEHNSICSRLAPGDKVTQSAPLNPH